MRRIPLALLLVALVPGASPAEDNCRFTAPLTEVLDAAGAARLRIDAAAGSLRIAGVEGLTEVRAKGTACAPDASVLAEIQLLAERGGDELLVEARVPSGDWGWNGSPRLDLVIEVPAGLPLEVEDGSGSIEVRSVAGLRLRDGSGSIDIEDVRGDLTIFDGSGEIDVRRVSGRVRIEEDGSGGVTIARVEGDVEIDEDGSGSIVVRQVGGSVRIGRDGSGSIRAEDVAGDFIVDRDRSGGISHSGVGGRVSLPD